MFKNPPAQPYNRLSPLVEDLHESATSLQLALQEDKFVPSHCYGKPAQKSHLDRLDMLALLISVLCLISAVVIINPSLRYAASLRVEGQIIALGFLLGIMNQCLQRILLYVFVLIECRYGHSILQNYEGLLRWSPFVSQFSYTWRIVLISLTAMPLGLSVLYKKFTGGHASTVLVTNKAQYSPTGPPGLQGNIGWNQVMANATIPFISAATDDVIFPDDLSPLPRTYGFNIILLSNSSAAAIDGPLPSRVTALQQDLSAGSAIYLEAKVRGSIAQHNLTVGNEQYWNESYFPGMNVAALRTFNSYYYGMIQAGVAGSDDPKLWNGSWVLVGSLTAEDRYQDNEFDVTRRFLKIAMRFDIKRHNCRVTWKITSSSIELVSGDCDADPLPIEYQYYDNCQLSLWDVLGRSISDNLAAFTTDRNQSRWKIPTHAVVLASAYQSIPSAKLGYFPIQISGPMWKFWNVTGGMFYEKYSSDETLKFEVAALKDSWGLYLVLIVQPALTIIAFCMAVFMFSTPISRTFGLVSIMAGADRKSLDLLSGATFSGELRRKVGLKIRVLPSTSEDDGTEQVGKIEYQVGKKGVIGRVRRRRVYE